MPRNRRYELKKRAADIAETRRRITEAAVDLHGTIGPARTTLSAVAERAGVQRQTLYRHFPTEAELFQACSAHYLMENPLPSLEAWRGIGDPEERLARALHELYAYYESTASMLGNVLRDAGLVDALRPALEPLESYQAEAAEILAGGWLRRGERRPILAAALHHAIDFSTWRSLVGTQRITRSEAVALITALVEAAVPAPLRPAG
jgi:AcrR family transcriptional regulator